MWLWALTIGPLRCDRLVGERQPEEREAKLLRGVGEARAHRYDRLALAHL